MKKVFGTNPALISITRGYFLMRPMYGIFKLLKRFVKSQNEKDATGAGCTIMSHTIDGVTLYCLSKERSNDCV